MLLAIVLDITLQQLATAHAPPFVGMGILFCCKSVTMAIPKIAMAVHLYVRLKRISCALISLVSVHMMAKLL